MANYKRVISYMYAYRNQLKGNNVGFARIETRGNECKITLHIRVVNMKDQEIGGYIYCWQDGKMHAVYLGDIHISNGVGELVVKTDVDNIMNSKYRFTEMGGILLYVSDAQYIATEWDGKAVLFDTLKIDTVKPDQFNQLRSNRQETLVPEKKEEVVAAQTPFAVSFSDKKEQEATIETAVAMVIPEQEESEPKEEIKTFETQSSLDEMIEDEVAKEEKEEEESAVEAIAIETIAMEAMEEDKEEERLEEPRESERIEREPQESEERSDREEEEEEEEEQPGEFPLSREKMEHLDKEAQELFGTMLLNTLFPPEKNEEKEEKREEKEEDAPPLEEPLASKSIQEAPQKRQEEKKEEKVTEQEVKKEEPETVQASETLTVSPKTAIQCFTAFRSCESAKEYEEIQEEIQTMKQEIKQLEHISKEWKIKEARLLEIQREKEEIEKEEEKQKIEERIRLEYNIDGIKGELQAAEVKRAVTERIFNKYPRIEPFEDKAVETCVRIEPQDLGIFPMENWILANNSFLLHGYYSYRHLIFMVENQDGKEHYLLGVPGVNHSREQFMANMFGFDTFKNLSSKEDESGEFGYWCHEIIM